ncbi:MarR family transcriptional regulator [Roseomonas sp. USHLN139]|uniref:MarR family transcriptional regulator n=1 Tax=Roseomonas sp. USHLN139 TaxID=3081298 RepID=UPI003B02C87A
MTMNRKPVLPIGAPSNATAAPAIPLSSGMGAMYRAVCETVRAGDDLTQRQLAVLMCLSLEPGPHTVRGLAAHLQVAKPVITRAIDKLEDLQMASRKQDPCDRRSVLLSILPRGVALMDKLRRDLAAVSAP